MSGALRVAVIGVGHLGQHHARLLAAMPDVQLVGVVDTNRARAEQIAVLYGAQPFTAASDVLDRVDAVSVAVPTVSHLAVAGPFLDRAIPVLVEKPMAVNLAEADELLARAARTDTLLAVGRHCRSSRARASSRCIGSAPFRIAASISM